MAEEPERPSLSVHGASVPRGLDGGPASGHGRFGRMFPSLPACDLDPGALEALLTIIEIADTLGDNTRVPAGFTYLGQFIDHDLTFDPNSQIDKLNDPAALRNFRSPRLDLDSVYGSGPADQPYLYDWEGTPDDPGVEFLITRTPDGQGGEVEDVPRNDQERALIGDPRNDVHLIITQLHLLFLRFHNKVVQVLRADKDRNLRGAALFAEACRIVRWHYQWIVVHDFLPKVVGDETMRRVLKPEGAWPRVERRFYRWEDDPYIPVEFSGAVYRFGHSMVRDTYGLRFSSVPMSTSLRPLLASPVPVKAEIFLKTPAVPVDRHDARIFAKDPETVVERRHLTGFRKLTADLRIDWSRFFAIKPEVPPQHSLTIDTGLAVRLSKLPTGVASAHSLPELNLQRGFALGLPSGQDIARAMGDAQPLGEAELFPKGILDWVDERWRGPLVRSTPLWYYVLAEAASSRGEKGLHLGPVGGQIVAEVLLGILEGDPQSYLSQAPSWTPELTVEGTPAGTFMMADLIKFTDAPLRKS